MQRDRCRNRPGQQRLGQCDQIAHRQRLKPGLIVIAPCGAPNDTSAWIATRSHPVGNSYSRYWLPQLFCSSMSRLRLPMRACVSAFVQFATDPDGQGIQVPVVELQHSITPLALAVTL